MSFFNELKRRNVIRVGVAYGIAAWFLLQISDLVLENIGAPSWVMQSIMLVLAIGFPLVMLFAWAFEMTPEGIKREKDVDRTTSITNVTGRKLDRAIIGILVITVAYLLVDKLVLQKPSDPAVSTAASESPANPSVAATASAKPTGPSVAVLPFVNMSGDAENEYFSDGLTETLLHMLAQLPELRVAARTSSFAFKGQNTSISEIAETLGVAHILEGSVQKANDRVRVTAQLIRADDGFHVWSQNYTRPLEDIFAIQDEIADDVASALGSSLLSSVTSQLAGISTKNLSAYDSYLKGLEQQAIFSYGSLETAENHFKQALARDPEFTDARLSLVRNYLLKNGTGVTDEQQTRSAIEPLIAQVRASDPDNRLARALELTLELQIFTVTRNADETRVIVEELRGLLQVIPTETYIRERVAGTLFAYFGLKQEATEVLQAGLMIDPMSADLHSQLGGFYLSDQRLEEARTEFVRSVDLAPNNPNHYSDLFRLERESDNLPAGLEWKRKATEVDPQDHELAADLAEVLYNLKLPEEGDRWAARVAALAPGSDIERNLEVRRARARDDNEQAVQLAEKAISDLIGFRQGAFPDTVFIYVDLMSRAGRSREAYDFLISVKPEIADFEQMMTDQHSWIMRWASFGLIANIDAPEVRIAKWQKFAAQLEAMGFPWKQEPDDQDWTWDHLMLGETDKGVEHYVEYRLKRPLAWNLNRHTRPLPALFGPVYEDPRVKKALDTEEQRFAELRIEVRDMLQKPEWQ